MAVAVVTDTTHYLPPALLAAHDVHEVSLYVGSKMYPVAGTPAITPESYAAASKFFESVGEFEKAPPDDLVDYDLVKEASGS